MQKREDASTDAGFHCQHASIEIGVEIPWAEHLFATRSAPESRKSSRVFADGGGTAGHPTEVGKLYICVKKDFIKSTKTFPRGGH